MPLLHSPRGTVRALRALALGVLLPLALGACGVTESSTDVNQDRIWTGYELEYDGARDVTIARARFHIRDPEGASLDLGTGSEVRFAGQRLGREKQLGATWYEHTFAGHVASGSFHWVDTEGTTYTNPVTLRAIGFPAAPAPLDNDASYTVHFAGPALQPGEEVEVRLLRAGTIGGTATGRQTSVGATHVVVAQSEVAGFPPGAVTGELTRSSWVQPAQRTSAGGRIVLRYNASPVGITVVD